MTAAPRPPRMLMAATHHWTSPFQVAGHQLARAFVAMGWNVAFVSNPISPVHLLGRRSPQLRERFDIWRRGGVEDLEARLWSYVPGAALTPHRAPLLRSRAVHRGWQRVTVPNVVRTVRRRGFGDVDVLYVDSVVQSFWLDAVAPQRTVVRVSDYMQGFPEFTSQMARMEADLVRRADVVVYTAHQLRGHVESLGARRAVHLPNGVDVAHFQGALPPVPPDLAGIPRPVAIYVGAMESWFDFDAVAAATAALPDVSFVLIGPDGQARGRLQPASNLHLLGPRPYRSIPAYLRHADVGLIPFDVTGNPALVNGVHPLKLYEYLASGIPVVGARWEELARLGSPALLYSDGSGLPAAIRRALDEPFDREVGYAFAAAADWRLRASALLGALDAGPVT